MADWQKTRYAQPKSWSEMRAESFEKKHPDTRKAPGIVYLGVAAFFVLLGCLGYWVFAILRFFGLDH